MVGRLVIQNIVSTFETGHPISLKKLALHARNIEYNPRRFAAAVMRIREPKTTALIFSTGKLVITGSKSHESSYRACRRYARIIQKFGYQPSIKNFKIQNIVASFDFEKIIRLDLFAITHPFSCNYEPELFPGLHYRYILPGAQKMVLLVFSSGKVVITGAQEIDQVECAYENMCLLLGSFVRR